jgi:hypothetical protein
MQKEHHSILMNQTWTLEDLHLGKHAITSCWVYKKKLNVIGDGIQHKVWLIVCGFEPCFGLDYIETFTLLVKWKTIYIVTTIATHNG